MKKLISTLIFTLSILLLSITTVSAEEIHRFKIVNGGEFNIVELKIMNVITGEFNIPRVGSKLKEYSSWSVVKSYTPLETLSKLKWEDPEYIIRSGEQTVKANAYCIDNNGATPVSFDISITGVDERWNTISDPSPSGYVYTINEGYTKDEFKPDIKFYDINSKMYFSGNVEYLNYENLSVGKHVVNWTFTPDDTSYKIKQGELNVEVLQPKSTESESQNPTLTASTLLLSENTIYDVNINNKPSSAIYTWKSSDINIAKVAKNGLVTAVDSGNASITCEIKDTTGSVSLLSAEVTVGLDEDNYPTLSETGLLLEVSDIYKLVVENKEVGSTVKFRSSDTSVATVTSSTGKVTAITTGSCAVYCTITTPDKKVIVLKCDVEIN